MVLGTLGYHDYEGPATELEERESLGRDIQKQDALILRNHGLLTVGRTIPEAFKRAYYLDLACQIQTSALATGQELEVLPETVQRETFKLWKESFATRKQNGRASGREGVGQ